MNFINHHKWRLLRNKGIIELSISPGDQDYGTKSTSGPPDLEMLEDEGNIFPNPETVIVYQHITNNKIENSRIEIRDFHILTIYSTGNVLKGLRKFERTFSINKIDSIPLRPSGVIKKVATNNV